MTNSLNPALFSLLTEEFGIATERVAAKTFALCSSSVNEASRDFSFPSTQVPTTRSNSNAGPSSSTSFIGAIIVMYRKGTPDLWSPSKSPFILCWWIVVRIAPE